MDTVRFVKSFSKGQITIPKEFRDMFGMTENFWLKLYINNGKIIAEPVIKDKDKKAYMHKLLNIKGDWIDAEELANNRRQVEEQIKKRTL